MEIKLCNLKIEQMKDAIFGNPTHLWNVHFLELNCLTLN